VRPALLSKIRKIQKNIQDFIIKHHPALDLEGRAEDFVRIFENDLPEKCRILDIGGGWGFYHEPLAKRGHEHLVLDVVKPRVKKCPVLVYDGNRIPFPDKSFDVSLFVTVLHHVPDPEALIREAIRVTSGKVILIEDLYHHAPGRWWTVLRDQILNIEFFGHPKNFKTATSWICLFESLGTSLFKNQEMKTSVSGFSILNGVFVFDVKNPAQYND
jgi:SAM-dependent methyltransferase